MALGSGTPDARFPQVQYRLDSKLEDRLFVSDLYRCCLEGVGVMRAPHLATFARLLADALCDSARDKGVSPLPSTGSSIERCVSCCTVFARVRGCAWQ